jgi:hypothetical protein
MDDVRVFKPMTFNEPVAKIARALKRTDGATRPKAKRSSACRSNSHPRTGRPQKGLKQSSLQSRRLPSQHAPSGFAPPSTVAKCGYATHRTMVMAKRPEGSSRGLCRTFHVQSPSRLGEAHLYLASRQPVEPPIPASTHLLRKSGQKQGFITRIKAEPNDKIAGDCCDLISRRVKEWQSHRGARCNSRFAKARRRSAAA